MTLEEALACAVPPPSSSLRVATGTDGIQWYTAQRWGDGPLQVHRLVRSWYPPHRRWFVWHYAPLDEAVDWCPGVLDVDPEQLPLEADPGPFLARLARHDEGLRASTRRFFARLRGKPLEGPEPPPVDDILPAAWGEGDLTPGQSEPDGDPRGPLWRRGGG